MKERARAEDGRRGMENGGGLASRLLLVREMSSMVHVFFGIDLDAVMRYGVSNGLGLIAVADDDGPVGTLFLRYGTREWQEKYQSILMGYLYAR